jgi:hypothetical protein
MLIRRILILLPALALFAVCGVIFLAGHAPRTWADHWAPPRTLTSGAGGAEFGASPAPGGWDILWVDDDNGTLVLSTAGHPYRRTILDRGDLGEPALLRTRSYELGAWIHNTNNGTALMGVWLLSGKSPRVFTMVQSTRPMEHPYIFADGAGRFGILFSWQERGNFENHVVWLRQGSTYPSAPIVLNKAEFYSFYPRAVAMRGGSFGVLYLDECCRQLIWNVYFQTFDSRGRPIGPRHALDKLLSFGGQGRSIPNQWGEDIRADASGTVWGAFSGDAGIWVFKASPRGSILGGPRLLSLDAGTPEAVGLALTRNGGYLIWEQSYDLGTYVDSQRFDAALRPVGGPERVVYASGSQTNPHVAVANGKPDIVWQTISRGIGSTFDTVTYRPSTGPTLAQTLGLGLGNPWEELGILLVGGLSLATLVTTANIILVMVAGFIGWVTLRPLNRLQSRWIIYAGMLTFVLYYFFVAPGGPLFFLDTIPSLGLAAMPYGFIACVAALMFVVWVGLTALKRIDDVYRAGIMAFLGVYFFAFLETVVFIQQRIGYV